MKKRTLCLCAIALVVCMSIGIFAGCSGVADSKTATTSYVTLSVNPEVEFVVDGDGLVVKVVASNADAEVLLANATLVGMELQAAAEKFVQLCAEQGYLDIDAKTNDVAMTVINDNAKAKAKIENAIEQSVNKFFENNGIFGKVSKATLDKYAAQAAALGVSVGHMKMILRAADMYADKTLEQLAALPTDELVQLIKDGNADICNSIKQQLKEKEEALKVKYAEMITLTKEVDELRKQIDTFVGTSADKMALVSAMTVKIARIAELTVQYTSDMAAEIEKAKVDSAALREQQKAENKLRIEQNKAKFEKHKNDFENNHKQIKDEIKNWRKQGNK